MPAGFFTTMLRTSVDAGPGPFGNDVLGHDREGQLIPFIVADRITRPGGAATVIVPELTGGKGDDAITRVATRERARIEGIATFVDVFT